MTTEICLKFEYDTGGPENVTNFFWNDTDITVLTKGDPPTYDIDTNTLSPVYFLGTTTEEKTLMLDIFGSIINTNTSMDPLSVEAFFLENSITTIYHIDPTTSSEPLPEYNLTITNSQTITTTPCCFSEGTNILSLTAQLKEEYRLVQDLMIGDFVKTYLHGYRKVSRVISGNFVNNPKDEGVSNCMYKMLKTEDNGLIEDLTLTRNHGVLVDKLTENEEKKVDKNNLSVIDNLLSIITADSDKFEKVLDTNVYKYYHFSLDGDGDEDRRFGVWANGILVEVPSNNMMDNVLNVKPLDF